MLELLLLIGLVYWIGKDLGDNAGMIALAVLIVIVIALLIGAGRDNNKAFGNLVDYWKDGGPDRK